MKSFFIVLARDGALVSKKCKELERFGVDYIVVCGEKVSLPKVVYREPIGKYDAINFGFKFVPSDVEVVGLNDVDTEIYNLNAAFDVFERLNASLVFSRVNVKQGPQNLFYRFLDSLRRHIPIAASGELMLIKYCVLKRIFPVMRCKAEDSYILFKVLELEGKVEFCEDCYVNTERTKNNEQDRAYKRRTVCGIYQALSMTRAPTEVRFFYGLLPFISPLLLLLGKRGYNWARGIIEGFMDYLNGDVLGTWQPLY
jgi:hypothetical protein